MTPEEFWERMIEVSEKYNDPSILLQHFIATMAKALEETGYEKGLSVMFDTLNPIADIESRRNHG